MLKIGVVDDHLLFRKSLISLINSFDGMQVLLDAGNGKEFLEKLGIVTIDVVLLDLDMPVMNGYETSKNLRLHYPSVKILVVSQLTTKESIHRMMELGAHGYFTKNSNPEQLENALRTLDQEGFYFGVELGAVIKEAIIWGTVTAQNMRPGKELLSDRELQIIKMICYGMKSKEIAEKLFITTRTVESHRKHIIEKTNSKNIIGAILFLLKNKLLSIEAFESL